MGPRLLLKLEMPNVGPPEASHDLPWRAEKEMAPGALPASPRMGDVTSLVVCLGLQCVYFPLTSKSGPREGNLKFYCFDLNKFSFEM